MNDSERHILFLRDMRSHASKAIEFVEGIAYDHFSSNEEKQFAVVRAIEVIGEAAKQVPDSIRELAPLIPWRQIVGTRDKLIHHYFGVKLDVVWKVTQVELPSLVIELDNLIAILEG